VESTLFNGEIDWVELTIGEDDHSHLIDPEDHVQLLMSKQQERGTMSDTTDVMIAGYLTKDGAILDYEAHVDSEAKIDGAVRTTRDLQGNTTVEQTDHMAKGGAKV